MSQARERETVTDRPPSPELVARVRELLERGSLVVLPTETVYGIAARADRADALEALRELKGRPSDLAFTWHVGDASALDRFESVSAMARRLAARYWPGPLTLVLPGVPSGLELAARDGWTGVRFPAHKTTAGILAALPFPVVMTSANRHGERPATQAAEAQAACGSSVALVVDGGPSRLAEASSVLRLGRGRFELAREGLFTVEQLRAAAGLKIAFVCTGNTCRSPMAEALARHMIAQRLQTQVGAIDQFGFHVQSMGVHASPGSPASPATIDVLAEDGIDFDGHVSRSATLEEVLRQDRVYGMTASHVEALRRLLPPGRDRHVALLDPDGADVPDPFGGTRADYARTSMRIRSAIQARLDEWV